MANALGVLGGTNVTGGSGTAISGAILASSTAGHGFVGIFLWDSTTTTLSALGLSGESAPTLIGSPQTGVGCSAQLCYIPSLAAGGAKTLTATLSGAGFWHITGITLSGQDTGTFYDSAEVGASGSTGNATGTCTTGTANCSIIAVAMSAVAHPAASAPATAVQFALIDFLNFENAQYTLDVGASGAKTVTMTIASNGNWLLKGAAFRTAAAAGSPLPPLLGRHTDPGPLHEPSVLVRM